MSTPDQPSTPPLTRRQLRELRNTGVTPVVAEESGSDTAEHEVERTPVRPRAADPAQVAPAPGPDAAVDLEAKPLTRRQARQQERIRTASVPVISSDEGAGTDAPTTEEPSTSHDASAPSAFAPKASLWADPAAARPATAASTVTLADAPVQEQPATSVEEDPQPAAEDAAPAAEDAAPTAGDAAPTAGEPTAPPSSGEQDSASPVDDVAPPTTEPESEDEESEPETEQGAAFGLLADLSKNPDDERTVINPRFGAGVVAGDASPLAAADFDELLARASSRSGSATAPSALIMSHTAVSPLVAPIAGTGEVLVTGTFALPDGLGSLGHARGTADGREADAILVDGEIPAHSSPTPIAASAAVSTIKSHEDIIHPPAPEKGGRLMITLAITAGVLALALVGVLVFALVTGVIS